MFIVLPFKRSFLHRQQQRPHAKMACVSQEYFNQHALHVRVGVTESVIEKMQTQIRALGEPGGGWSSHVPNSLTSISDKVNYLCMVVAIDYRHWGYDGVLRVGHAVAKKDFYVDVPNLGRCRGSQAMVEMLKAAGEGNISWYNSAWLSEIANKGVLRRVLTGIDASGAEMEIPDFEGRYQILLEISAAQQSSNMCFYSLFTSCGGRIWGPDGAIAALCSLHRRYNDVGSFHGSTVPLMKLAQLTIIAVASVAPDLFLVDELSQLTICPDYQVPKALRHIGALSYSDALAECIKRGILLERDGSMEVEVRLGSVIAAELLRKALGLSTGSMDFALWKIGRESIAPHHLCETCMY